VGHLFLESLEFEWVHPLRLLLVLQLVELLFSHDGVQSDLLLTLVNEVSEYSSLVEFGNPDGQSVHASAEISEGDLASILEVQETKGVSEYLESALDVSIN
jgi:hypothetical protein